MSEPTGGQRNHCDGCAQGRPVVGGIHTTALGTLWMACTADRAAFEDAVRKDAIAALAPPVEAAADDLGSQMYTAMQEYAARMYDVDLERSLPTGLLFGLSALAAKLAQRQVAPSVDAGGEREANERLAQLERFAHRWDMNLSGDGLGYFGRQDRDAMLELIGMVRAALPASPEVPTDGQ